MSIKQIGAEHFALDVRIKKDGRQHRTRETFTGCRKKAEQRYWALKNELQETAEKSGSLKATVNTFADIIDYYLEREKPSLQSFEKIEYIFDRLRKDLGNVPIVDLADKFDRYLRVIRKEPSKKYGRPISNCTYNRFISYAKIVCNFAVKYELIERSPLTRFAKLQEIGRDKGSFPRRNLAIVQHTGNGCTSFKARRRIRYDDTDTKRRTYSPQKRFS